MLVYVFLKNILPKFVVKKVSTYPSIKVFYSTHKDLLKLLNSVFVPLKNNY